MHQAEKLGNAMYTAALSEAALGISSNAQDYMAFHDANFQLSSNTWWQFMATAGGTGRALDLVASTGAVNSTLWYLMSAATDPRFAEYFDATNAADGAMNANRLSPAFPQPFVTYNENQLIIAEANLALGTQAAADAAYDAERTAWTTTTPWHSSIVLPARVGSVTLAEVMYEKYVTLFQNTEVWNDWKRTCTPRISQRPGGVPGRLYYGQRERQSNTNIPATSKQPARNANDPTACT